jgi:hypothetical protein
MTYPWKIHYVVPDNSIISKLFSGSTKVDIHTHGLKRILGKELECVVQVPAAFIASLINSIGDQATKGHIFKHKDMIMDDSSGKVFGLLETVNGNLRIIIPDKNGSIDPSTMSSDLLFQFEELLD